MKSLDFNISYGINDGSMLQVAYTLVVNGNHVHGVLPLREVQYGNWNARFEVDDAVDYVLYGYEFVRQGKVARCEWSGKPRKVRMNSINYNYRMFDRWLEAPAGNYTHTSLFKLFGAGEAKADGSGINWYNRSITLMLYAVGLREGEQLAIVGDADVLGNWRPEAAIPLNPVEGNRWSVTFNAESIWSGNFQFKFITRRSNGEVRWEEGDNRSIFIPDYEHSSSYRFELPEVVYDSPAIRLAGTVIPLFSLRSEHGWGVGDFGDIKLMVDWLVSTGQSVLQLLPLNDTTINGGKEDSYPYNCVSVFALNPIYADTESLPRLRSEKRNNHYQTQRNRLNNLPTVDYAAVYKLKMAYMRELFDEYGCDVLNNDKCRRFISEQSSWLKPYTLFRFLTSRLRCNIWDWKEYRYYDSETEIRVLSEYPDARRELDFYTFVQYLLYSQLTDAHNYATGKGVALKGDIPIGVAPNGVDVWCDSRQFNLSVSAGAPPDMFSADGQNWGFPTYNWDLMAADGYSWWRRRLQYMSRFFDAYRIDHVLGFFRIWEIPRCAVSGLAGRFSPNLPLSRDELASFGLHLSDDALLLPYIDKASVKELFGRKAKAVTDRYFAECGDALYTFKKDCNTLQELRLTFADDTLKLTDTMRESLLRLQGNVLFFKDGDKYIPRIAAFDTPAYARLSQHDKAAFERVYQHYFYERHNMFWYEEGMRKLAPVIQATQMTACGEDLGMIPDCVPWVMRNLQILSLEIQRMPKTYGLAFANPADYPSLSVATPSTHDMSTLRGWWREDASLSQQFYNNALGFEGKAPVEMDGRVAQAIIRRHLASPSMLALFAWQDLLAMDERLRRENPDDERINVPSNRDHVWNYRMHISIERMLAERGFNEALRLMIEQSGRGR